MPSPCDGVCIIEDGRCTSCNRTRADIAKWGSMTSEEQRDRIKELRQQYPK